MCYTHFRDLPVAVHAEELEKKTIALVWMPRLTDWTYDVLTTRFRCKLVFGL